MIKWLRKVIIGDSAISVVTPRTSKDENVNLYSQMGTYMSYFGDINAHFPFEVLDFLNYLAITNPDINHATTNFINLANNGHYLSIESDSDRIVEKAQARLNYQAYNLYKRSAGVDGLINHYLFQLAIMGAISSEDVLTERLDGVDKIAIVPVRSIRFRYEDNKYQAYQKAGLTDDIALSDATYRYYAFKTMENSPYAIPLFISAIQPLLSQDDMQKNIKFIIRKFGLLGLVAYTLKKPPKRPGEAETEHTSKLTSYLAQTLRALSENYYKGLMVKYEDQELEHHSITGEARGSRDIWDLNEEQVASGLGMDAIVLGRAFHSTETFANVTYMFLTRQSNNVRRLVKRRMENTYRLDLMLQNIPVDNVAFMFKDNPARDPQAEATAEETRQRTIINKATRGLIEPDVAAQELGYDYWFDTSLMHGDSTFSSLPVLSGRRDGHDARKRRLKFRYDSNQYKFVRDRVNIHLISREQEIIPFRRGVTNLATEKTLTRIMASFAGDYYEAIEPFLQKSTSEALGVLEGWLRRAKPADFINADDFAEKAYNVLAEIYVDGFKSIEALAALKKATKETYEYFRLQDESAFAIGGAVDFTLDVTDKRTLLFMRDVDRYYLGKYIYNEPTERSIMAFLKERFLESNDGLFGRTSPETVETFISLATDRLESLSAYEATRIINTSVARMRNWGNIGQLNEAGFQYAEIYNPAPEAEICIYMNGALIPVGIARDAIDRLSAMAPEAYEKTLKPITAAGIKAKGIEQATRDGESFPPYHPNCKTRVIATQKVPNNG